MSDPNSNPKAEAIEELTRQAMASGVVYFAENRGNFESHRPLPDCFENWPAEFLAIRGGLTASIEEAFRGEVTQ